MSKITKKEIKYLKKYVALLKKMPEIIGNREKILKRYLPELTSDIPQTNDLETKIEGIIGKIHPYPNIFLASSLGFTKMTWNKNTEKILNKFGLEMKLKYPTFKNYQKFETLKLLLIKYLEKKKISTQNED